MKCGREQGGLKASILGTCPAATDSTFDGFNLGEKAGRTCWRWRTAWVERWPVIMPPK